MQPDSIVPEPGNPQDLNRYSYARNNPLYYRDPSGHWVHIVVGALAGAGIAYGVQVVANVCENGLNVQAFTDVDAVKIVAGAAAGAVGAATCGAGAALLGTSWGATLATGAVSGVASGQASRLATNALTDRPLTEGLGNPVDIAVDAAAGAAGAGIAKAWRSAVSSRGAAPRAAAETTAPKHPGRLGGARHRAIVNNIVNDIENRGLEPVTEFHVPTPGGWRGARFVDVAALDPITRQPLEFHQVGNLNLNGFPIAREMQAIWDILTRSGFADVPLWFYPK